MREFTTILFGSSIESLCRLYFVMVCSEPSRFAIHHYRRGPVVSCCTPRYANIPGSIALRTSPVPDTLRWTSAAKVVSHVVQGIVINVIYKILALTHDLLVHRDKSFLPVSPFPAHGVYKPSVGEQRKPVEAGQLFIAMSVNSNLVVSGEPDPSQRSSLTVKDSGRDLDMSSDERTLLAVLAAESFYRSTSRTPIVLSTRSVIKIFSRVARLVVTLPTQFGLLAFWLATCRTLQTVVDRMGQQLGTSFLRRHSLSATEIVQSGCTQSLYQMEACFAVL
ncbi:MAG TPA: hypothetical protein VJX30_02995 [Terriglobales bacterium]|nr:hypothetical protein [Terriglobales bacterium]